jgi:hypothetical protein
MKFKITRIDFSKSIAFADEHSAHEYLHQFRHFKERNRHWDTHYSFWEDYHVQGFTSKMLSMVEGYKRPLLLHWAIYLLFSFVLLSWPYRLWLDRTSVKANFHFQKVVGCHH